MKNPKQLRSKSREAPLSLPAKFPRAGAKPCYKARPYIAPNWLPPVGASIRVVHQGQEQIAYVDRDGKWRNPANGALLLGEVLIVALPGSLEKTCSGICLPPNPSPEEIEAFCKGTPLKRCCG